VCITITFPRKPCWDLEQAKLVVSIMRPSIVTGVCLLLTLSSLGFVSATSAQSFVGGDLSNQAPFGLPASDFADATSHTVSNTTFQIVGYNTSIPAGPIDATGSNEAGWSISIGVSADVALASAADGSVDKFNKSNWRVCAIIFPNGLAAIGGTAEKVQTAGLDGSCAPLLPSDCIQQLQINSVNGSTGANGGCTSLSIPSTCAKYFQAGTGTGYGEINRRPFPPVANPHSECLPFADQSHAETSQNLPSTTSARRIGAYLSSPQDRRPPKKATAQHLEPRRSSSGQCF
jgi:hypothetical protein